MVFLILKPLLFIWSAWAEVFDAPLKQRSEMITAGEDRKITLIAPTGTSKQIQYRGGME
jgi:hypothetical protein